MTPTLAHAAHSLLYALPAVILLVVLAVLTFTGRHNRRR